MTILHRLNVFWLGAGGFLALFCANEIIAYHLSRTPKWLGGPMSYAGMVVGVVIGLSVAAFLGVEEPRETLAADESDPGEDDEEGDDEGGQDRASHDARPDHEVSKRGGEAAASDDRAAARG
jgi:hypothetical protein